MADFITAVSKTLVFEGGYSDLPADKGGPTKYGISSHRYPDEDIENLTLERAKFLYKRDYWDKLALDFITSQAVAEEMFDTAVNMGPHIAVEIAQEALGYLGKKLSIDGVIGPVTVQAINTYPHENALLKTMNGLQFMRYVNIVRVSPDQKVFFRGWLSRVQL
jgi:lysozyme family protein